MVTLLTTLGPRKREDMQFILPHEHIYVDMQANMRDTSEIVAPADVVALMAPHVQDAQRSGVTAMVDCTPVGVGRRADVLAAVSEATGMPFLAPTGVYREPWIPGWVHDASEQALFEWMLKELTEGIGDTGVTAAWIKLSAGDDGMTACEEKVLRAAARAGRETHAVIGSHTIKGTVALRQIDIIEAAGYTAERFIWIHTQNESAYTLHQQAVQRGAWIEYDAIGAQPDDEQYIGWIRAAFNQGYADHILLSQDRGWYTPEQPGGGTPRPFTYITDSFLPKLREAHFSDDDIMLLMRDNPYRAFAR